MAKRPSPVLILNEKAFRSACAKKGAMNDAQIAKLIGVDRSTVWRALNRQQKVGPTMITALVATFGPDAQALTKMVRPAAKAKDAA